MGKSQEDKDRDEILRRMLRMPPSPKKAQKTPRGKKKARKRS